ncbi:hypothetical protein D3C87_77450 [compost metagenome]
MKRRLQIQLKIQEVLFKMSNFNPVEELKILVTEIEGKMPTDIVDLLEARAEKYLTNDIVLKMHIGKTDWDLKSASEWLLSMFIGIVQRGRENPTNYNAFENWLIHVYHFVINNNTGLE